MTKTKTDPIEESKITKKQKFRVDKKHLHGFIAGVLAGAILAVSIMAVICSGAPAGAFTGSDETQEQISFVDVGVSPGSIAAVKSISASFSLDIPAEKISDVKKEDLHLAGFFEGMDIVDLKAEGSSIVVGIEGAPKTGEVYDSDTGNSDGYISVFCGDNAGTNVYSACVSVDYPRLYSQTHTLEYMDSYDTGISLTLAGDSFVKTPSQVDISLGGIFKGMQVSDIAQDGKNLSFHIKGSRCEDQINGQVRISKDVLSSGLSVEKLFSVTDGIELFSITPITVETPFEETLTLRVSHDCFTEDISRQMFTLGEGLKDAAIVSVEYINSMSVNVTLRADEMLKPGNGTIALSKGALQSGRSAVADISIESPSISLQGGDDVIMASLPGEQKEYTLTIYSSGNDFLPSVSAHDFTLGGALSSMSVTGVEWQNGYKIALTIKGSPEVGEGTITVGASEFGGVADAECSVTVSDSAELYGRVNLSDYLPGMKVSFCGSDGSPLDIPEATTDKNGSFLVTVTSGMPADSIAFIKAANDSVELSAPFSWSDREGLHVNAFTTLMAHSIANAATEQEGIAAVYRYLGFEDDRYSETNYGFASDNSIFSHELFEEQANGDINGYIEQLKQEMDAGKTRSFASAAQLSGETGALSAIILEWGVGKLIEGAKAAGLFAAKEGSLAILRKAGILKPSTTTMLEDLQSSVDALSDQVRVMKDQIIYEIKQAELQRKMDSLSFELNNITFLYAKYLRLKGDIEAEVDQYNKNHPDTSEPPVYSELPVTTAFFGPDGVIAKEKLDKSLNNIINILNGTRYVKPLITEYHNSLTESLPFAHNAAQELYSFMQYVTSIEAIGLSLYSNYCAYTDDAVLKSSLDTLISIYEASAKTQEKDILPDKSVFRTDIEKNVTTVKLNCNGKYYKFSDVFLKMKDSFISYYHGQSMGRSTTTYSLSQKPSISDKDIKDIFYSRDMYHSGMSHKKFLTQYLGKSLPDWLLFKTEARNSKTKYAVKHDNNVTFYDIGDNVYRSYLASDLYKKYADWITATVSVTQ